VFFKILEKLTKERRRKNVIWKIINFGLLGIIVALVIAAVVVAILTEDIDLKEKK